MDWNLALPVSTLSSSLLSSVLPATVGYAFISGIATLDSSASEFTGNLVISHGQF